MPSFEKSYFDTVRDESTLSKESSGEATLASLLQSPGWKSAASHWGRSQLLAHRVVCTKSETYLPILEGFLPRDPLNPAIQALIEGPVSIEQLGHYAEAELIQDTKPDSLGYIWAAMRPFVDAPQQTPSSRDQRQRKKPQRLEDGVPSDVADLGSSPETGERIEISSTDSSFSSVGFIEVPGTLVREEDIVQLASFFIRHVLNYAQSKNQQEPFVEFRSNRLPHSYAIGIGKGNQVRAVDDGGIQFYDSDGILHQIALLECKRNFRKGYDYKPEITDALLGQMLDEALAVQRTSEVADGLSERTDYFIILTAAHCLRLLHFKIPPSYVTAYNNATRNLVDLRSILRINSTEWLDVKQAGHRKILVTHLLAFMHWAHNTLI